MTTYNFSVRATDNLGAFADRAFDITVNNTSIERFVAVGQNGLAHSQNGIAWTYEAGLYGTHCHFGNGQWAVVTGNGVEVRTSPDAINWTTYNLTLPQAVVKSYQNQTITVAPGSLQMVKYVDGAWRAFTVSITQPVQSYYAFHLIEYKSVDLVNWTFVSSVYSEGPSGQSSLNVSDMVYDPISMKHVLVTVQQTSSSGLYVVTYPRSRDVAAWDVSKAKTITSNTNAPLSKLVCTNGLWAMTINTSIWTSFNAIDWIERPIVTDGTGVVNGLTYANGRLITRQYFTNFNTAFWTSLDGGRSWTRQTVGTPGGIINAGNSYNRRNPLVSYGGIVLASDITDGGTFVKSVNDGTDLTSVNDANYKKIGVFNCFGVRTL